MEGYILPIQTSPIRSTADFSYIISSIRTLRVHLKAD